MPKTVPHAVPGPAAATVAPGPAGVIPPAVPGKVAVADRPAAGENVGLAEDAATAFAAPLSPPVLTPQLIEAFLQDLRSRGRGENSIKNYGAALQGLYRYLPPDKLLGADVGPAWQRYQLQVQQMSPRTVNAHTSAYNSLLRYLGRKEWQLENFFHGEDEVQPELTRTEYLRLLCAARDQGNWRTYLLIKTLGGGGMRMQELPQLTVQAVRYGTVRLDRHNNQRSRILHIPAALQQELLAYLAQAGIADGPVFVTPEGQPLSRACVYRCVNSVCRDARVAPEKATPRRPAPDLPTR